MSPPLLVSMLWSFFLLLPLVLLSTLCSYCRQQRDVSMSRLSFRPHNYTNPSGGFTVIRPNYAPPGILPVRSVTSPSHFLSIPSPHPAESRRSSFAKTDDDGKTTKLINEFKSFLFLVADQNLDSDYVNEDNEEQERPGEGYIVVLPDPPAPPTHTEPCPQTDDPASNRSSVTEEYVNVPDDSSDRIDSNSGDYVNLNEEDISSISHVLQDDYHNDSEDDGPDYVNAPERA
ncbi:hypothetical protein AOXY_G31862 [Acipenser oxyrinchus oxyrinchus]|uniref:Linker for activation of T-cells family member 1 n=1 Tax=Acipenser oxyrinchus oxyrinchus TaxID=40147 RepID=A0AAD8CJ59_ACIOX|nr:hypothetical protein AOXY_G31862 [Acipenser oxyrinchus oxyrinchus]